MDNIEILLEKIRGNKIAYTLVNSIKNIPEDNKPTVLKEVLDKILSEKVQSFQDKDPKNEN